MIQTNKELSTTVGMFGVGGFQHAVLTEVSHLGRQAYGAEVRRRLEAKLSREVSPAQVYAALIKLEKLGFLNSSLDASNTAGRRGRTRRIFRINGRGQRLLAGISTASAHQDEEELLNDERIPTPA